MHFEPKFFRKYLYGGVVLGYFRGMRVGILEHRIKAEYLSRWPVPGKAQQRVALYQFFRYTNKTRPPYSL